MAEDRKDRNPEELSVQLNEAFERLEKQHQENVASDSARSRGSESNTGSNTIATDASSSSNIIGTLLALIALGVASYATYMIHTRLGDNPAGEIASVKGRLSDVETRFEQELSQVGNVRARLNEVTADLAQMDTVDSETLAAFEARIDDTVAGIRDRIGTSSQDWLLAEVEYLLRLGAQRVAMEQDASGALALFKAADEIIRDAEGIAAFDLRKAIANDIAELEAVSEVDVDGIYVRLSALANRVPNLAQKEQRFEPEPLPETTGEDSANANSTGQMLGFFERIWDKTTSLVDYRSNSEPITPILPPKEEYYLRQNLVLKLQMAQLGLLRSDQTVYANSITEAQEWVTRYFDRDDQATIAMENALDELAAINVEKEMPDVTQSVREVRKLLASFHEPSANSETMPKEERARPDTKGPDVSEGQ